MRGLLLAPFNDDPTLPCRGDVDPDDWFPESPSEGARAKAVKLCTKCHRRAECLLWSLRTDQVHFGVLAGLTPRERRELKQRAPEKPAPPARSAEPFGWRGGLRRPDPDKVRRVVAAARRFVAGDGSRASCAARYKVSASLVGEATAVLRADPVLLADVERGWLPLERAYRYVLDVQRWAEKVGAAA